MEQETEPVRVQEVVNMLHINPLGQDIDKFPLLTPLIAFDCNLDNQQSRMMTRLTPGDHPYLKHHVFGGVPLVPGAVLIEMACEASLLTCKALGLPEKSHIEIDTFEIYRAVAVPFNKSIELKTRVTRCRHAETLSGSLCFDVEFLSDARNAEGNIIRVDKKHCSARVLLSSQPNTPEFYRSPDTTNAKLYELDRATIYRSIDTHGRLLQSLTGRLSLSLNERVMFVEFTTDNLESEYVRGNNHPFYVSPLAIDSAFQCQEMWIDLVMNERRFRLPIGGRGLKFYRPVNRSGRHFVFFVLTREDNQLSTAHIVVTTENYEKCFEFEEFRFRQPEIIQKT